MDNYLKNNSFFLVSIGAIPAAIFRWHINEILIVNTIGCLLLGFINGLLISRKIKLIFGFGFCGSLTSFSGLTSQLYELIRQGSYKMFFFSSLSAVIIGLFAVGLGHFFAKRLNA